MGIPTEFINALQAGTTLVVEVGSSAPERRAWVTIDPVEDAMDRQAERQGWTHSVADRTFRVQLREVDRAHEGDWQDIDLWSWKLRDVNVTGEESLEQLLHSWSVSFDDLKYPWKTDCPF